MARFTLTVRNGPRVERSEHDSLDAAIGALADQLTAIRAEGALPEVRMLRDFKPHQRVKARLEVSAGRAFRRREAGVDLMGDGSVVPYSGGIFKRPLEGGESDPCERVRAALRESAGR